MDRKVIIAGIVVFVVIAFIIIFIIRAIANLFSPEPTPPPFVIPSPIVEIRPSPQPLPVAGGLPDDDLKEFRIENEGIDFTVKQMKVNTYDRVRVTFRVLRGQHTFTIKEFNVTTRVLGPGEQETIEFTADKPGNFQYFSSVVGERELGMTGTLTVK